MCSCPLGTVVTFKPGMLIGGEFTHDCPVSRAVGYFIEPILMLAPFAKNKCGMSHVCVCVCVCVCREVGGLPYDENNQNSIQLSFFLKNNVERIYVI
jgi:hypothetical protein